MPHVQVVGRAATRSLQLPRLGIPRGAYTLPTCWAAPQLRLSLWATRDRILQQLGQDAVRAVPQLEVPPVQSFVLPSLL